MRDLPPSVRMLGHPVTAALLTGGLALAFLALVQAGPGGIFAAMILLIPAGWVVRAAEAVHRQRQWKRAWDSMAVAQPTPSSRPVPWSGIIGMALLGVLAVLWGLDL